jgi:hypothetical protein
VVGRSIHRQNSARPADRNIPLTANLIHQLALMDRP